MYHLPYRFPSIRGKNPRVDNVCNGSCVEVGPQRRSETPGLWDRTGRGPPRALSPTSRVIVVVCVSVGMCGSDVLCVIVVFCVIVLYVIVGLGVIVDCDWH